MRDIVIVDIDGTLDRIAFVIEDRDAMVKKWREMGLVCVQVADGNY